MEFEDLEKNRIRPYIELVSIEYIKKIIKDKNLKRVLEIGTCHGYSALKLSTVAKEVTTLEKDKPSVEIAKENFEKYKVTNIKIIEGNAIESLKGLKQHFDLVLIDAMKKEYKAYLIESLKLVKRGYIYADNTISHKENMLDFFEYLSTSKLEWKELNIGRGLVEIKIN